MHPTKTTIEVEIWECHVPRCHRNHTTLSAARACQNKNKGVLRRMQRRSQVIELRDKQNLPFSKIGRIMHIEPASAESLYRRAKAAR